MQETKRTLVMQARQLLVNERRKMVKKEQLRLKAVAVQRSEKHVHKFASYIC